MRDTSRHRDATDPRVHMKRRVRAAGAPGLVLCVAMCLAASTVPGAMPRGEATNVYFGSLGAYRVDARDTGQPREEFERARIVEGMDFLAVPSPILDSTATSLTASLNARLVDRFVAMYAWRYGASSRGSHVSVLEPRRVADDDIIPDGRFDLFYRSWLPQQTDTTGNTPIVQFAESHDSTLDYGRPDMQSLDSLRATTAPYVRTIQIGGPSERGETRVLTSEARARAYLEYLNAGFKVAPTADSEGVWRTTGGEHRTAVIARRLARQDLLESIRARRVYATDDTNLNVSFSINHCPMGSIVPISPGTPLRIELTLSDADEPGASYWISLRRDSPGGDVDAAQEFAGTDLSGNGTLVFTQFRHSAGEEYFLVHIVQRSAAGADHVWTAPIWLVSPAEADSSPGATEK